MVVKDVALSYVEKNWKVFPCRPGAKEPRVKHGCKAATSDRDYIREWWDHCPEANVAVATGAVSGVVVLDVDTKNDAGGEESLEALVAEYGELPDTLTAKTPSGGQHIFFTCPEEGVKNAVDFRPGLDFRGDGGYVLVAPSVVDGAAYRWLDPDAEIAAMPGWLLEELARGSGPGRDRQRSAGDPGGGWPEGQRDDGIFRYAAQLRGRGVERDEAERLVLEAADACNPPFEHAEALKCLDSAYERYEPNRQFPLTDAGNAERLVTRFGDRMRYVTGLGMWVVWDGVRWSRDSDGQIQRWAKETARGITSETEGQSDPDLIARYQKFARTSENRSRLMAMIELATSEDGVSMDAGQFDSDPWLFGCSNGVVDLRTGEFREPGPRDYMMKRGGVAHDPDAACPRWREFLTEVFAEDQSVIDYVQRAVGYTLTGDIREHKLFLAHGTGANGKSTFLAVVEVLLGDYARSVASETLMSNPRQPSNGPNEAVLRLMGARMASTAETEENQMLAEALVKRVTGGDSLVGRPPYAKSSVEFVPQFKIWMGANHLPIIRGSDHAIWRRIEPIPFTQTFEGKRRNPYMREQLLEELPGILNWAIEGALEWQRIGLATPETIRAATKQYRDDMDLLGEWMETNCDLGPEYSATVNELYRSYTAWAHIANVKPMSRNAFARQLASRGFARRKISGARGYEGLRPKPSPWHSEHFGEAA